MIPVWVFILVSVVCLWLGVAWGYYQCLRRRVFKLEAELENVQGWYESVMDKVESQSTILYYRCGVCGGPVSAGLRCAWCDSDNPVELEVTDED
jgi:hypothetical protein